jgi:hypothetical protein
VLVARRLRIGETVLHRFAPGRPRESSSSVVDSEEPGARAAPDLALDVEVGGALSRPDERGARAVADGECGTRSAGRGRA